MMYQIYIFGLYNLCIWGFDLCNLGTLEHVMYDIVGGYPKAYADVLGVLRLIGVLLFYYYHYHRVRC